MKKLSMVAYIMIVLLLKQDLIAQVYDYFPSGYVWGFSSPDNIELKVTSFSSALARTKFSVKKHDNTTFGSNVSIKIRLESTLGNVVTSIPVFAGDSEAISEYYYFASDLSSGNKKYYATLDVGGYLHRAGPVYLSSRLETPQITMPTSGTTIFGNLNVSWSRVTQASVYRIVVSESSTFTADPQGNSPFPSFVFNDTTSDTTISINNLPAGSYSISIRAGSYTIYHSLFCQPVSVTISPFSGIGENLGDIPRVFSLYQNYPNPFNPSTVIRFAIPKDSRVRIQLYTLQGEEIAELLSEDKNAGYYEIRLEIPELASGVYLYRIIASSNDGGEPFISTKKLILMK